MSDSFQMLVDVDVTLEESEGVSRAVLDQFRERDLIAGSANPDCVLGGEGYRPGPAIRNLYKLRKGECRFWELVTCGVEPSVGRGFNEWALGPSCEGFCCPSCGAFRSPMGVWEGAFGEAVDKAVGEWWDRSGSGLLRCPRCGDQHPITQWRCKPPLGFGNLSFRFWNWPPLDSASWEVNIVGIIQKVSGHRIVMTHGHI